MAHPQDARRRQEGSWPRRSPPWSRRQSWQDSLAKFGWIDAYQPADEFATLLKEQEELIGASLKDLGLAS